MGYKFDNFKQNPVSLLVLYDNNCEVKLANTSIGVTKKVSKQWRNIVSQKQHYGSSIWMKEKILLMKLSTQQFEITATNIT